MRFHDGNLDGDYADAGDSTLYVMHDAQFTVTGVVDASNGSVVERYVTTAYGERLILNAYFGLRSVSSYDWIVGHQGLAYDLETGLVYNRARYLHTSMGIFTIRDPMGYVDGMGLNVVLKRNPSKYVDPSGTIIEGLCEIADYLRNHRIAGFTAAQATGNRWKYTGSESSLSGRGGPNDEILIKMLASGHTFEVKDGTSDNLDLHVTVRQRIVAVASLNKIDWLDKDFGPAAPDYELWRFAFDAGRRGTILRTPDENNAVRVAFNGMGAGIVDDDSAIWNGPGAGFRLGCADATMLVLTMAYRNVLGDNYKFVEFGRDATGDTDWIPGDRGYVLRKTETEETGEQSENVIYLGFNLWWGHVPKKEDRIMTLAGWKKHVGEGVGAEVRPTRWFPSEGLVQTTEHK